MDAGVEPVRVKVWLPIKSLGWVNSYLVNTTLIDPGMATGRSLLDLARGLKGGPGMCGVERVVITHFHVDHSTAAPLVYESSGAELMIGAKDLAVIQGGVEEFVSSALRLYVESGMPKEEAEEIRRAHPALRLRDIYQGASMLDWKPLREGGRISLGGGLEARVVEAPGHTPGHIMLELPGGGVIVGDTLLPGITPHVTLHSWEDDPLGDYMATLGRIASSGYRIAYPGHRDPIMDPRGRAMEILGHHKDRLGEVLASLRGGPLSGYEVARRIRWRTRYSGWHEYPPPERFFAMGEALAHLRRLEVEGLVERVERSGMVLWRLF